MASGKLWFYTPIAFGDRRIAIIQLQLRTGEKQDHLKRTMVIIIFKETKYRLWDNGSGNHGFEKGENIKLVHT